VKGRDELASLARTFNRMANSLEDAETRRRSLTADIAHELRNPLAVQRANLEAMQDGLYPVSTEALEPVLEQNLFLTRLVEDLRMLALADAGELILERAETDLAKLVEQIVERYKPQASLRQIRLEIVDGNVSPKLHSVWVDPVRIEQILGNLLSNALRHSPEGGLVRICLSSDESNLRLEVHDDGTGIPEDSLDHIFDRFYRADRSRSRVEGGTGLGLAIARKLAEAHGGTLQACNHPEGGALFTLTLPRT
jgi:two-component system, OmpR family, sensor histidine kinase BaeS